jgi:predicted ABC-type ATPase
MSEAPRPPVAVIVAGPNGAGKSTMAPRVVARGFGIGLYINPDTIAQGLAAFDPASAGIEAGRTMHRRLEELRAERTSFAVESTISGLSLRSTVRRLRSSGYAIFLVYLWLPEPALSVERVANRVRLGGHDVPEEDIRRRFYRSVVNFDRIYRRITNGFWVYHALKPLDEPEPRLIAYGAGETKPVIVDAEAWREIQRQVAQHSQEER